MRELQGFTEVSSQRDILPEDSSLANGGHMSTLKVEKKENVIPPCAQSEAREPDSDLYSDHKKGLSRSS